MQILILLAASLVQPVLSSVAIKTFSSTSSFNSNKIGFF